MEDRDSIYLDTISITSNSTYKNNRRSLALSRQTIYHSAEDVNEDGTVYSHDTGDYPQNGILKSKANGTSRDQGQVSEAEVEHYARKFENLEGRTPPLATDEVTALLPTLDEFGCDPPSCHSETTNNTSTTALGHLSNKTKKETITYPQWKARVNTHEYDSSTDHLFCPSALVFPLSLRVLCCAIVTRHFDNYLVDHFLATGWVPCVDLTLMSNKRFRWWRKVVCGGGGLAVVEDLYIHIYLPNQQTAVNRSCNQQCLEITQH